MRKFVTAVLTMVLVQVGVTAPVNAQSAMPTTNVLFRVLMIKSPTDIGSMFSVEVDNREYWVTAKHLLTGAKHPPLGVVSDKAVTLSVLDPTVAEERWVAQKFSVIDPGKDIDIVVLAPERSIQVVPIPSLPMSVESVGIGGECEFLGFPFATTWMSVWTNGASYKMPFIKHCYVSGEIPSPLRIWVLDGINNDGFSGGPVVFDTGPRQKIFAVVSGYRTESTDVIPVPVPSERPPNANNPTGSQSSGLPNPVQYKPVVNVNSGFIYAFDISYALDAIKKNPIGATVERK
jgi:hypothetical protein